MIYNKPAVPDKTILLSLSIKFNPNGPITAPAIIKPNKCGIFNLFSRIGANKMITNININFNIGLVSGKDMS
jgi:hypothetical protein